MTVTVLGPKLNKQGSLGWRRLHLSSPVNSYHLCSRLSARQPHLCMLICRPTEDRRSSCPGNVRVNNLIQLH